LSTRSGAPPQHAWCFARTWVVAPCSDLEGHVFFWLLCGFCCLFFAICARSARPPNKPNRTQNLSKICPKSIQKGPKNCPKSTKNQFFRALGPQRLKKRFWGAPRGCISHCRGSLLGAILVTLAALADTKGRLRSILDAAKDLPKTKRHKHRKRRPKRGQKSPKSTILEPFWHQNSHRKREKRIYVELSLP
jgi:hypothetical protein